MHNMTRPNYTTDFGLVRLASYVVHMLIFTLVLDLLICGAVAHPNLKLIELLLTEVDF